jgi:hypothetical protein
MYRSSQGILSRLPKACFRWEDGTDRTNGTYGTNRTYTTNRGDGADRAATPRFIIA